MSLKALFANYMGIVLQSPNNMFILTLDGSIKNMAIETLNPSMKGVLL
jgi:hypothetical protein